MLWVPGCWHALGRRLWATQHPEAAPPPAGRLTAASLARLAPCNWPHPGAAPEAALADVLRVHEWSYVRGVRDMCTQLAAQEAEGERGGAAAPPAIGKVAD